MAVVRKIKKNVAEVTFTGSWDDGAEAPSGSTTYTAGADGDRVDVTFTDGRPPQIHTLKAGAKVKESTSGSVHINGNSHP